MIKIVEVGPRDGLQNEKQLISTEAKLGFIRALLEAGLTDIEITSFVSPKWVPQLGDAAELWPQLPPGGRYSALVPNMKGLERALQVGVERIALFTAASDLFTEKNINMTVDESITAFGDVANLFRAKVPNGYIRAYVSTAFECPYAGKIKPEAVLSVTQRLLALGIDELSIGDTIGVAVPSEVRVLTTLLLKELPVEKFAYHFHDTRGTAIANVAAALDMGVRIFDSSAGGLGGCPYAPGAGGNLATDDLVYFLERSGVPTGIDPVKLANASSPVLKLLGRVSTSKVQVAVLGTQC